ncbi:MAG: bifunctional UDP-N-acetylglucosamine diphosphorylase/glucosamine-1-phosphate N-acetyltransferase GlmU [Thermomicrobiales bacterium]
MNAHLDAGNPPQPASVGVAVAVLAAGHGTRMKSSIPKHLHPVGGVPIVERVIRAGLAVSPDRLVAVVGPPLADLPVRLGLEGHVDVVLQETPRGTADAVRHALAAIGSCEWLVSLLGDNPLLTGDMIGQLVTGAQETGSLVTVLTSIVDDAQGYGRIDRDGLGRLRRIVEKKNDDPAKRVGPTEINSGIMVLKGAWAQESLTRLQLDATTNEFLLTDLIELAVSEHRDGEPWPVQSVGVQPEVAVGVNTRQQLAEADAIVRRQVRDHLMESGVTILGPETVFIDETVEIGQDTVIHPFTVISGRTTIGANCRIGPHAVIECATIGDDVAVIGATVVDSSVAVGSSVGPYSRLRQGATIGPDVHIGNFVEVKNSQLGVGTKAGHHAYLGDATVGERVNIGAGVITANYDGVAKHRTQIGDDAFIGSDSVLVAPRTIGDRGRTGAGAVVTHDVDPDTLVVGVPARPRTSGGSTGS